jgi:hypothetical protein
VSAMDDVIRAAGAGAVMLARLEERQRSMDGLDAFADMVERLGTALTVSICLPAEAREVLDGDR